MIPRAFFECLVSVRHSVPVHCAQPVVQGSVEADDSHHFQMRKLSFKGWCDICEATCLISGELQSEPRSDVHMK